MTTATKDLVLTFNVNRLVLVEKTLGRTIAQIVEELESGAPSLGTMRALLAAGTMDGRFLAVTGMAFPLDLGAAGTAMERHGTKAVSAAIGGAMADFLSNLG
jgi:NADH:ubiquinone oxidoreductase subunit F (NADH-binding)